MIDIKCFTSDHTELRNLIAFQGDLKEVKESNVLKLQESLKRDGLLTPFFVWRTEEGSKDKLHLLDGHARKIALSRIDDPDIEDQMFPIVEIVAETEEEARETLLQINSHYGKITKEGLKSFTAPLHNFTPKQFQLSVKSTPIKRNVPEYAVVRVKVKWEDLERVTVLLKKVDCLEVME